jgi:phosphoenolpyruvate synthase/pyruvate phosphate dikinase
MPPSVRWSPGWPRPGFGCRTGSPRPRTVTAGSWPATGLAERIRALLDGLGTDDVRRLAAVCARIRQAIVDQPLPEDLEATIRGAYAELAAGTAEQASHP